MPARLAPATLALLLVLSAPARAACPPPFTGAGDGTFYFPSPGAVACGLPWTPGEHVAAINGAQWAGSAHCGEYLRVTGPLGSTVVKIVDQCPECVSGDIDLSQEAFAAIANPIDGRVPIQWERIARPGTGNLVFHFESSNAFFLDIQVREHRYGVQSLEVFNNGSFQPMSRQDYNRFQYPPNPSLPGPLLLRVTATTGEAIEQTVNNPGNGDVAGSAQFAPCSDTLFRDGFETVVVPAQG